MITPGLITTTERRQSHLRFTNKSTGIQQGPVACLRTHHWPVASLGWDLQISDSKVPSLCCFLKLGQTVGLEEEDRAASNVKMEGGPGGRGQQRERTLTGQEGDVGGEAWPGLLGPLMRSTWPPPFSPPTPQPSSRD